MYSLLMSIENFSAISLPCAADARSPSDESTGVAQRGIVRGRGHNDTIGEGMDGRQGGPELVDRDVTRSKINRADAVFLAQRFQC